LKIRFLADADLRRPILTALKRHKPAIDFKTAREAGLAGLDDLTVLGIAADEGRVLVSHDVSTMPESFARFIRVQIPIYSRFNMIQEIRSHRLTQPSWHCEQLWHGLRGKLDTAAGGKVPTKLMPLAVKENTS
jgi:hypothetical protein